MSLIVLSTGIKRNGFDNKFSFLNYDPRANMNGKP